MSVIVYGVRLLPGDVDLHREIMGYRGTAIHGVARWLNYGGTWQFLAPAMLLLQACSRAARRRWWLWCGLLPIGGAVEQLFKFLVGRPRPRGVNPGFPSGHVTAAATFAVLLAYLLSRERVSSAVSGCRASHQALGRARRRPARRRLRRRGGLVGRAASRDRGAGAAARGERDPDRRLMRSFVDLEDVDFTYGAVDRKSVV